MIDIRTACATVAHVKVTLAMLAPKARSGGTADSEWGFAITARCQGDEGLDHHCRYRTHPSEMHPDM